MSFLSPTKDAVNGESWQMKLIFRQVVLTLLLGFVCALYISIFPNAHWIITAGLWTFRITLVLTLLQACMLYVLTRKTK